jgi:hypothetical protein
MPLANISGPGSRLYVEPAAAPENGSILFVTNGASNYEYGRIAVVPTNFGAAEFGMTLWGLLTNATASSYNFGDAAERTNWSAHDVEPYSAADAWYHGNFFIDGHNNASSAFHNGTLSLQIVGTGRPRWTFGDGAAAQARTGQLHVSQVYPSSGATNCINSGWHKFGWRRRNDGGTGSILENWLDGVMIASETSTARTNMYTTYWDDFAAQPAAQRGFFFGAEKQAAVGVITQYAAFMGNLAELCFWEAPSDAVMESLDPVEDSDTGLLDVIRFTEGSGSTATGINGTEMTLNNGGSGQTVGWGAGPF